MSVPAVDMHCHLDLYPDPKRQVEEIGRSGAYVLSVTTTPSAWPQTRALATAHPRINTALGLHPQLARERRGELGLFDRLLPEVRYVGEVGLDGAAECKAFWPQQVDVFEHVLRSCVNSGGRILTVHSRSAATPVLQALERHRGFGVAVLHWFTGTKAELLKAVEVDCWFSVGNAMVRSKRGRELVALMPTDRVLTETDGPFAKSQGVSLRPAQCDDTITYLSELWSMESKSVRAKIVGNFRRLVSL